MICFDASCSESFLPTCLFVVLAVVIRIARAAAQAKKHFLDKRWLTTACPLFARFQESDENSDCVCPLDKSACYEDGRPWCTRSDGSRDYHYFSMTCEVCTCQKEGSIDDPGSATREGQCKASGVSASLLPDSSQICTCPQDKPLCVTRDGLLETAGCKVNTASGQSVDAHRFVADCYDCACREACPTIAAIPFADSFGDCVCGDGTPTCFEDGAEGCTISSQTKSNSYFASTCGKRCTCRAVVGTCEPNSCVTSTDCAKPVCSDCDICQGISRCTQSGVVSEFPNAKGNCECGGDLSCFQPGSDLPGCPIAPFGVDAISFRPNCGGCRCEQADFFSLGIQCPVFAASITPNRYGDCQCPADQIDCYKGGVRWCERSDLRRDLHYFAVGCNDCECRQSSVVNELERQMPCPNHSRFAISDIFRNCACPLERPLCVEGSWPPSVALEDEEEDSDVLTQSRPGPLCNTTHGWSSSNSFRWDCGSECRCVEVEGEGDRLRKIEDDELVVVDGSSYMKHFMYVDIRIINTFESVTDWPATEVDVTIDAKASYADGVVGGLGYIEIPVDATIQDIEVFDRGEYRELNKESVRTMRVHVEFGVMWAWGRRLDHSSDNNFNDWIDLNERSLEQEGLKTVDELTARETNLLLNFQSIFNDRDFKIAYDHSINTFLNRTWELRKGNASTDAEPKFAPRVEAVRLVVDAEPLSGLRITGPLALEPPVLNHIDKGEKEAEEEDNTMLMLIIVAGILLVLCMIPCCFLSGRRIRKRLRERRHRRAEKAAKHESDKEIAQQSQHSPRSPTSPRSPRSPGRNEPATARAKRAAAKGKSGAQLKKNEIGRSMMFSGGGDESTAETPRSSSPRSPRADGSARKSRSKVEATTPRKDGKMTKKEQEKVAKSERERVEMEKARKKKMKKLGDLAGIKSLSAAAKIALQAEYEEKFGEGTQSKSVFGRRGSADRGRRPSVTSEYGEDSRSVSAKDFKERKSIKSENSGDSPASASGSPKGKNDTGSSKAQGDAVTKLRSSASGSEGTDKFATDKTTDTGKS